MNLRTKYPRTFHLPNSPNRSDDDKVLLNDSLFSNIDVVVTEKMDGENTTVYQDGYVHARSIDGTSKPWQSWLQAFAQSFCHEIPDGWRVCGENLYAKHSIDYDMCWDDQKSLFQVFSIYDDKNVCLSWNDTIEFCWKLKICHVPIIFKGKYDRNLIAESFKNYCLTANHEVEGYVVRSSASFNYSDFQSNVAKYVRANHVQTDEHWTKHWTKTKLHPKDWFVPQ